VTFANSERYLFYVNITMEPKVYIIRKLRHFQAGKCLISWCCGFCVLYILLECCQASANFHEWAPHIISDAYLAR